MRHAFRKCMETIENNCNVTKTSHNINGEKVPPDRWVAVMRVEIVCQPPKETSLSRAHAPIQGESSIGRMVELQFVLIQVFNYFSL